MRVLPPPVAAALLAPFLEAGPPKPPPAPGPDTPPAWCALLGNSLGLKTVERSAIANKVWPHTTLFSNPTGAWATVRQGDWSGTFTTTHSEPDLGGLFGGLVILPSSWLLPEKLELVGRYQFQVSDQPEGIRLWSRYARRAELAGNADLGNGGRGDRHHSFYGGLNYHFCRDLLKVMAGLQYDHLSSSGAHVYRGWTSMVGFRIFS